MLSDNVRELERRRSEHGQAQATVIRLVEENRRLVEENRRLREAVEALVSRREAA